MTSQISHAIGILSRPRPGSDTPELPPISDQDESYLWAEGEFVEVSPIFRIQKTDLIDDDPTLGEAPRIDSFQGEMGEGDSPDVVSTDVSRSEQSYLSLEQTENGSDKPRLACPGCALNAETLLTGQGSSSLVLGQQTPRGNLGSIAIPNGEGCAGHHWFSRITSKDQRGRASTKRLRRKLKQAFLTPGLVSIPEARQVCESH